MSKAGVLSKLILDGVQTEATRAHAKHGEYSMLGPNYSASDRLAILVEEVGEVAHELTYDVGNFDKDRLIKELFQVAAMAATWIEQLNSN